MPAQTSMLHVRVNDQLKTKAADTLLASASGCRLNALAAAIAT